MAKGQAKLQQEATQRSSQDLETAHAAQSRLINNPELAASDARNAEDRAALDNGTFQSSSRFLSNRDAAAQRVNQRNSSMSLARTGFGALGARYADPNQLAQQDNILRDENARDMALQAEQDKRTFANQTYGQEENNINRRVGIDTNIMGSAMGSSINYFNSAANIASQRSSLIPAILGPIFSGIAGAATAA